MAHIQAIPTAYNGTEFRSRLEARWAVFFHMANYKYEYEPDGPGTTPDFYIPSEIEIYEWETIETMSYRLEVKPAAVTDRYLEHLRSRNVDYLLIGGFYKNRKPTILGFCPNKVARFRLEDVFAPDLGVERPFKAACNYRFDLA